MRVQSESVQFTLPERLIMTICQLLAQYWSLQYETDAPTAFEAGQAGTSAGSLDEFLAGIEKRAFRRAQIATGSADEALDIVQDAMLKLVTNYAARPPAEWGPLFHRILQSRILDWHRRALVRNRLRIWFGSNDSDESSRDWLEGIEDTAGRSPEQLSITQHDIRILEAALQQLPLRQQQVFLLRAWEGLNVAQTASAMGCSEGTVKTHYSRARQFLRTKLGEEWL